MEMSKEKAIDHFHKSTCIQICFIVSRKYKKQEKIWQGKATSLNEQVSRSKAIDIYYIYTFKLSS